jgi:hypothetical protein
VEWHNDLQLHCGCGETPYRSRQPEGAPENACKNVADRREIVRLVQGRTWHISLKLSEHLRVYQDRAVVLGAAMYDAVADGARRHALLFPQPSTG